MVTVEDQAVRPPEGSGQYSEAIVREMICIRECEG